MKRKSISGSSCVKNISNKILRIEVQPAQTKWVERVKRFVNDRLYCVVRNLKDEQNFDVTTHGKNSVCPMVNPALTSRGTFAYLKEYI